MSPSNCPEPPAMARLDPKVISIWTARFIPVVLTGIVGYATYVFVARLCVAYLLRSGDGDDRRAAAATAILAVYFLLLLFMATAYFRVLYIVMLDPGYVPLPRPVEEVVEKGRLAGAPRRDSFGTEYGAPGKEVVDLRTDADAPGLEQFYTKDAFVCEQDGRPKWCAECRNWKPDRAHHCSDVGRCVNKMDHFCPWVGGVVGENSFKFFILFVFYAALYCLFLLIVMAFFLHEQLNAPDITYDPQFAVILGLATFFGLFTFGMTCNSVYFALMNLTTIENLNKRTKAWQLAVYIPERERPPTMGVIGIPFPTITYPLLLDPEKASTGSGPSESTKGQTIRSENNHTDLEHHAERDAKAKRTFAMLRMKPGLNPWDLGAAGNWKSVMGNEVLDWFLPIRRSPLCNHESGMSQFALGAHFEKLKADNGLLPGNDRSSARPSSGRKSRDHSHQDRREIKLQKHAELL